MSLIKQEVDSVFEVCCYVLVFQLNPDVNVFQRKFVNEVRRCEEMDRKLRMYSLVLCDIPVVSRCLKLGSLVLSAKE